jgi:hypothetical protein
MHDHAATAEALLAGGAKPDATDVSSAAFASCLFLVTHARVQESKILCVLALFPHRNGTTPG